jgi:hypothetical protein
MASRSAFAASVGWLLFLLPVVRGDQNARVDRGSHRRDFLLDTLEDGGPTLADWKPRSFAHARQRFSAMGNQRPSG